VDLGRDRVQQPRDQGRRELLQEAGQSHHHRRDRAQVRARYLQAPPARRLRSHVPASDEGRHGDAADDHRRDDRQDDPRQRDGGEQRDRYRPGRQRDRRRDQGEEPEDAVPHRRGAGRRQGAVRCRGGEGRPRVGHRAQDLRSEGHRRAVGAPQAADPDRPVARRRRSRARHALRHAAGAADRRLRQGCRAREGRDGRRGESG